MPGASGSIAASRVSRIRGTQEVHPLGAVQRTQFITGSVRASDRRITFWDAEGAGDGAFDDDAGVVVLECGTLEPSGALIDTLGTSGPLTLTPEDAEGDPEARGGKFFLAPGGT
jgi:hypothetical protein